MSKLLLVLLWGAQLGKLLTAGGTLIVSLEVAGRVRSGEGW